MFGDEINAFISLDIIYRYFCGPSGSPYIDHDVFNLLRRELHKYFFGFEKSSLMEAIKTDLGSRLEKIKDMDNKYGSLSGRPWLMPLRLSFEKRFDGRETKKYITPVPILCFHPSWKYYISGTRIRTDYPMEKINGKTIGELESFPEWMKFGITDYSRSDYIYSKRRKNPEYYEIHAKKYGEISCAIIPQGLSWEAVCIRDEMDDEERLINS